jgi:uncharacterized protein YecT (DUF1311 family)
MMTARIAIASVILLCASIVQADPVNSVDYQAMYDNCLRKAGRTNNASVAQCSSKTFEASQREINRLYDRVYRQIVAEQIEDANNFKIAHKSWLTYRDRHCELAGSYIGSPMYGYCPMQLNITRVIQLRTFLKD